MFTEYAYSVETGDPHRMMESAFMEGFSAGPTWVKIWVGWMMIVNSASLAFLKHKEARVVLGVWLCNATMMMLVAEWAGYTRIMGLVHVIWWTPLVIYLWKQKDRIELPSLFGRWIMILIATNGLSLIIDYVDVVRYMLGDRG